MANFKYSLCRVCDNRHGEPRIRPGEGHMAMSRRTFLNVTGGALTGAALAEVTALGFNMRSVYAAEDPGPRPERGPLVCGVGAASTFLGQAVIYPLGRRPLAFERGALDLKQIDLQSSGAEAKELQLTSQGPTSTFDAIGGPWGFWLRPSPSTTGIDVYFPPNAFSDQPDAQLIGTIPDTMVYAGRLTSGDVFLSRHNWFNQGAQYRSIVANYPEYPRVTVVDYMNLYSLQGFLPELVITPDGEVDLSTLLPLLMNTTITSDPTSYRSLLALLSSCAATDVQRAQLASTLALSVPMRDILLRHGVLLYNANGMFSTDDLSAVDAALTLYPDPIKDQLHVLILDESTTVFGVSGGYSSGGIINIASHASTPSGFVPYPSGRTLPRVNAL